MIELDFSKPAPKPSSIEEGHLVIDALWTFCGNLHKELALLKQEVIAFKKENAELKERLNTNSNNSSKPPSTDSKKNNKKKNYKGSGRHPGGQPGHKGVFRKLVPIEQVDAVITCPPPDKCQDCNVSLLPLKEIVRHQVYEIPLPRYEITEYQILQGLCSCCQKTYRGETPAKVGRRGFGVRVHSSIALLTSKFKLSKRQALELLKDFFQMPICVGSVSNIEHRVSQSLEPLHTHIKAQIDRSKVAHIDETGFKQSNHSGWAWILANELFSFLQLDHSRGKKVAKKLIGSFMNRIIVSDRYPAYDFLPELSHQVCWAHLKRDFQKISERSRIAGVIGRRLLHGYGKIFAFWKSNLQQAIDDKRTRKKRRQLKNRFLKDLEFGASCSHLTTARTCRNILDMGKSLWLFLENRDVPATNNLAERQIRPLVIAKKLSFGVKSDRGARFIERAYSLVLSCRQQNKNALSWLQDSITSHFISESPPLLI
ncbi:MAG TPA: IS66 family transposase [Gammaproteobacteria bacterium]|nr:IS66 family transposase [Gammaproteobacteria bacterium]HQZ87217.1 IS66 family transposase [Gammaproteobacteria bacterium]HRA43337.1 IS66 family transposase [Gammaproteobacteria bacterium]